MTFSLIFIMLLLPPVMQNGVEGKSGMRSGLPVLDEHMAVCVTSFPGFHVTTLCLPNVMLPDPCRIPIPLLNSLLLLLIRHLQYRTHFCANFILQVTNAQRPGNNTNLVHSLARVRNSLLCKFHTAIDECTKAWEQH